jgi:uncharacterized UPF0146 family protein
VREVTVDAIATRLATHDRVVEVGIGHHAAVASALFEAGVAVTATDIDERPVPDGATFVRDDVTDPAVGVYDGAEAIYALNCPPELHQPLATLARHVDADCHFTTLGADPPTVPVDPETIPGETLYTVEPVGL